MRLGFGVGVVDVGTQGGVADAADGAISAAALFLIANGPYGMVIDFADASIALTDDSKSQMFLAENGPLGMVIDFTDASIAIGGV